MLSRPGILNRMKASSDTNDTHMESRLQKSRRSDLLTTAAASAVDVSIFLLCFSSGLGLSLAQMVSFAVAAGVIYFLKARAVFAHAVENQERQTVWLPWQFGLIGLLVLFLRGGVLSLLVKSWGWMPQVAIFPAAVIGVLTMVGAVEFLIRLREADGAPESRWRMLAVGITGYIFALRLIYLGQAELLPEEAYYWNYSQHLDIGYLDHPPMVAWLIWLGTSLFGQNEFGVRVGAFGCWMVTSWFVYRMTANFFDKASAFVAVLLVQVLPFFFSVGFLMTPDAPLVACWAGALYFAERALIGERRHAWWGVGVCLGLGLISKYSIGVLGPAMLLFLILDSRSRRWFLRWEPYAAVLVAVLIFSPVIIWNFQHGWVSFGFQGSRRLSAHAQFSLHTLIASAVALLTPTGLLAALWMLFQSKAIAPATETTAKQRLLFIQVFTLVPLAVFVVFSLRHRVQLNWTGPLWLAVLAPIARSIWSLPGARRLPRLLHAAWAPTILVAVVFYAAGLYYLVLGLPGVGYSKQVQLVPVGWRDLADQVGELQGALERETHEEPLIVGMQRNFLSSELAFYDPGRDGARETAGPHLFGDNSLMYEWWFPKKLQEGRTLLLVSFDAADLSRSSVLRHVAHLGPIKTGMFRKNGQPIRPYYYCYAFGYRSAD
jgi:dolichol-phosphate mannosyltransferase